MTFKALIVDDEKEAAEALRLLLKETCPQIKVTGNCTSAMEAGKVIKREKPDILFLDIEMPGGNGFDLLDIIEEDLCVIFTTAHDQYAIKAIKKGAKDYLLKPIDPDELVDAVDKATKHLHKKQKMPARQESGQSITIHTNEGLLILNREDLLYIKAAGRYSELYFKDHKPYLVCKNIGEYEDELKEGVFFRVHRSYLINCKQLVKINSADNGFALMSNGLEIEISKRKRAELLQFIK